jgi:hypothetical protein
MNSIWLAYCKYLPYNFDKQIEELDFKLIDYAIDKLYQEAIFYQNYLRDSDIQNNIHLPTPENSRNRRSNNLSSIQL